MADLFSQSKAKTAKSDSYTAEDIEVLEGLEPVRRRPGMYIGGTDENAMQHLVSEVFDNAMDEAVAGHASRIEMELAADNVRSPSATTDAAFRSIPHPKFPKKSALEVILTMLHSGRQVQRQELRDGRAVCTASAFRSSMRFQTRFDVEVIRDPDDIYKQSYSRGAPLGKIKKARQRSRTARAPASPFTPTRRFSGPRRAFAPSGFINSRARRRICSGASKYAGNAILNC